MARSAPSRASVASAATPHGAAATAPVDGSGGRASSSGGSLRSSSSSVGSGSPSSDTSSFFVSTSSHGSDQQDADDADNSGNSSTTTGQVMRWSKKPRRNRSGWGPYKSVLRERSVDFNLTLDIQNLKQEIQNMETFRDILLSKTLIQRHDPEGSLVRVVQEHYRIFRMGFNLKQSGRKRLMDERDQREFLRSVFSDDVDVGAEENGLHVLEQQIMIYTMVLKTIGMSLTSFEVVTTDDTVVVVTKGILHFQILRNTIAAMFPHVMSEEWLVSKLVGKEVAPDIQITFYFNKDSKICKFTPDLDYVKTFSGVLTDPAEVDILLGRASVTENSLIVIDDNVEAILNAPPPSFSPSSSDAEASVAASPTRSDVDGSGGSGVDGDTEEYSGCSPESVADDSDHGPAINTEEPAVATPGATSPTPSVIDLTEPDTVASVVSSPGIVPPELGPPGGQSLQAPKVLAVPAVRRGPMTPADHFVSVVHAYFRTFAQGSHASMESATMQFLDRYFSASVRYGDVTGRQVVADRWRSLSWCFNVLSFRQVDAATPVAIYEPQENRYRIHIRAEYMLQLTRRSVELVFPHVIPNPVLADLLAGALIVVASDVTFWLERGTGLLAAVRERMDFESALGAVVFDQEDLAFVLAGAAPILLSFVGEVAAAKDDASPRTNTASGAARVHATIPEEEKEEGEDEEEKVASPGSAHSSDVDDRMRVENILV